MIVFDASTLILLAKVEALDMFWGDYKGEIVIPREVEKEATVKRTFDGLLISKRIAEGKIRVVEAPGRVAPKLMQDFSLNQGEAEAIALALKNKDALLATDDKNAIKACKLLNLDFTTAVDFIVRAREKSLLKQEDALTKLTELARYGRYKKEIIKNAESKIIGGKNAKNAKRED